MGLARAVEGGIWDWGEGGGGRGNAGDAGGKTLDEQREGFRLGDW